MTDRTPPLQTGIHPNVCVSNARRQSFSARNEQRREFFRTTGAGSGTADTGGAGGDGANQWHLSPPGPAPGRPSLSLDSGRRSARYSTPTRKTRAGRPGSPKVDHPARQKRDRFAPRKSKFLSPHLQLALALSQPIRLTLLVPKTVTPSLLSLLPSTVAPSLEEAKLARQ